MSLRQLRTRIEHLEAKSPEPVNNEERAAHARWEELRLRQWKQANRPNEVEEQLAEEEKVELKELTYRFDRFAKKMDEMAKMCEEAADKEEKASRERIATRTRSRSNES